MSGMQTAMFAIFFQFNSIFQSFFILLGKIINSFALRALHFYHVILRHKIKIKQTVCLFLLLLITLEI
jgi:hypothetical protein